MIISTNKSDTMLKRCLGKDKTVIISIDKMMDQFSLDPTMTNPTRDAYIVTNEDISARRIKDRFEQALASKHPAAKVIFINKSSKPIYPNGLQGLDAILQKPKPQDITQTISAVISANNISDVVSQQVGVGVDIPQYTPEDAMPQMSAPQEPMYAPEEQMPYEPEELYVQPEVPQPEPEPEPEVKPSSLVARIQAAGTVGDVSSLMREITATNLIKDLYETNSTYAGIEEKLKSLNDTIFNIMADSSIKSLDDKLAKIHALLHDKAFFRSKGDTLIEQRLEEVIDCICTQTSSLLQSRLSEIDAAIRKSFTDKDMEMNSARLGGLNEARANIIMELTTLQQEIIDIYRTCDTLVSSTATDIAQKSDDVTGNPVINDALKVRGSQVISDDTITALRAAMDLSSDKIPTAFKTMKRQVLDVLTLLRKLFDMDNEVIAAQQAMINYLKSNNIEDTVTAESVLKKSLRVYVGDEKCGRTVIPYLISKYKSRQNANVLLIDLTGTAKYSDYGIQYTALDTFVMDLQEREFMLAVGSIDNSISSAQRLLTALLKAADFYRVINVVMSPEQTDLFTTLANDILSVNFIVDTNNKHIEEMRNFIEKYGTVENVARRVIINRCDVAIRPIITRLGLDDTIDFQVCTVPEVPAFTEASLNGFDPYGISSVDLVMEEVLRHA